MKKLKRCILIGLAAAVLALALPWFVPIDHYRTLLEQRAAQALRQPVAIGALDWRLLPRPALRLQGVRIGHADAPLAAQMIVAAPALRTSLAERRLALAIDVHGLHGAEPAIRGLLAGLAAGARPAPDGPPVRIARASLHDARIAGNPWLPAVFHASATLSPQRRLERASLRSADGQIEVQAVPAPDGRFAVEVLARGYRLPGALPLSFERLQLSARIDGGAADIGALHARLYGGALDATGRVSWNQGWTIDGEARSAGVSIAPLLGDLRRPARLDGRLSGNAKVVARAADPAGLARQIRARGSFSIESGVLRRVDLESALGGSGGGETRFDELAGDFEIDPARYRFTGLRVSSGVLAADGDMVVGRDRSLSGRVNAGLRTGVTIAAIPLQVSGTLDEPSIRPTAGAIAGAAAGTMLLPGIGTALGARLGGVVERMLGGAETPQ